MRIGVPKEIKNHEYRVGLTPASVREFVAARPRGAGRDRRRRRHRRRRQRLPSAPAPRSPTTPKEVFAKRRHDRQGQGAAARRTGAAARGPDPLHLSAPRPRSRADQGPARLRRAPRSPTRPSPTRAAACRCWRRCRRSPAACRSRPAPRLEKAAWRPRRAARRRARRAARQGRRASAAAWSAPTPRGWPLGLGADVTSSTARSPRLRAARRHLRRASTTRYSTVEALEEDAARRRHRRSAPC